MPEKEQNNPLDNFVPLAKDVPVELNKSLIESTLAGYQPEAYFNFAANGKSPYQKFLEENFLQPIDKKNPGAWTFKESPGCEVEGRLLGLTIKEVKAEDGTMKPQLAITGYRITSAKQFKEYLSASAKPSPLRESQVYGSGSYDFFADTSPYDFQSGNQGVARGDEPYVPIMGGPFSKQLYLYDYLLMHSRAFELWNHNPVAHQIIKVTTYFTLGRGYQVKFKNAKLQEFWDRFEKTNDLKARVKNWSDMAARDGELMVRYFRDPLGKTGDLFVRAVDPSTIWEIVTDPEDIEKVYYYHQQYPTQYQNFYENGKLDQVLPSTKYVINHIPAGEIKHYKLNCNANEKRGRSDLYPVMTTLKRLMDFYSARTIRAIQQACVVWKNIVDGDQGDIDAFINNYGTNPPKAGTLHVENKQSTLTAMTIDIKAADARDDGEALLNLCAIGTGIPKEYLGLGDKSTKATANVAQEPGLKKFQDRQDLFRRVLEDVADEVARAAMAAGEVPQVEKIIPEQVTQKIVQAVKTADLWTAIKLIWSVLKGGTDVPLNKEFEIIIPELITEDRTAKIKDLTMMQLNEWISKETAGSIAAKEMHIESYDYKTECQAIKKDREQENPYGQEMIPELGAGGNVKYKTIDQPGPDKGPGSDNFTGEAEVIKAAQMAGMPPEFIESYVKAAKAARTIEARKAKK